MIAKKIVESVLFVLHDRGGFDGWWDHIDDETQDGIVEELEKVVAEEIRRRA